MLEKNRQVQASILDRLLDDEPDNAKESARMRAVDFRRVMAAVSRDLENLLNSRRNILPVAAVYPELRSSLYIYGLPDFTNENPAVSLSRSKLRFEIEKTVARFEPRLKNVSVKMDTNIRSARDLRFRIVGVLVVDPLSEPVAFDTDFDTNRGRFFIQS